jgi:hypothetical protein
VDFKGFVVVFSYLAMVDFKGSITMVCVFYLGHDEFSKKLPQINYTIISTIICNGIDS